MNRGPENIVAAGGNVFVSSTDGTVAVIDTTTLTITKFIKVGSNPAQMVVAGDNLYVSNTGGFSATLRFHRFHNPFEYHLQKQEKLP